jgi:hypothetical protein
MWKSKNRILLEQIDFLRAQVAQLQNYVLMTGAAPMASPFAKIAEEPGVVWDGAPIKDIATEAQRMYTTELEEDIEYQLQEGHIGEAEAKRLMREAGAIADDIEAL